MTPGEIRNHLEKAQAELKEVENDLFHQTLGAKSIEVRCEVAEALDDIERAMEILDSSQ